MKYLLLVACFAAVAFARRSSSSNDVNIEEQMKSYKELAQKVLSRFPSREFQQFWGKIEDAFGEEKEELYKIVRKHDGDMDMTIAEVASKLGQDHSVLKNSWENVKRVVSEKSILDMLKDARHTIVEHLRNRHNTTPEQLMERIQTEVSRMIRDNGDSMTAFIEAAMHELKRVRSTSD